MISTLNYSKNVRDRLVLLRYVNTAGSGVRVIPRFYTSTSQLENATPADSTTSNSGSGDANANNVKPTYRKKVVKHHYGSNFRNSGSNIKSDSHNNHNNSNNIDLKSLNSSSQTHSHQQRQQSHFNSRQSETSATRVNDMINKYEYKHQQINQSQQPQSQTSESTFSQPYVKSRYNQQQQQQQHQQQYQHQQHSNSENQPYHKQHQNSYHPRHQSSPHQQQQQQQHNTFQQYIPQNFVNFEELQKNFLDLINPENNNKSLEETTAETGIKTSQSDKGYTSRFSPDIVQHHLTLTNKRIDSGFQPLVSDTKLEVVNSLDYSKIPKLAHGLDRVVTEKGVHPVSDFDGTPKFSRFLSQIHDFDSLILHSSYMIPSQDKTLLNYARENNCKYLSSTSSITSVLTKLYFTLTKKYNIDTTGFNSQFQRLSTFTPQSLKPISIFMNYNNSVWAIDNNSGSLPKSNQVLMDLGHSLEKMLTLDEEEFNSKLLKSKNSTAHEFDETYIYSKFGDIMYRSQIDCYSDNLTGKSKTFDLKTRATRMIRLNVVDHESFLGYHINQILDEGTSGSYEKEMYDMCRSAAIKYSLQARIGNMAGIFVCYHNTKRIFGSEFLPLDELENIVFWGKHIAEDTFNITNSLLSKILAEITSSMSPQFKYRLVLDTQRGDNDQEDSSNLLIFVEELSVSDSFEQHSFTYKHRKEYEQLESRQIVNPVTLYKLSLQTTVNGFVTEGPLHYSPKDELKVYYQFKKVQLPKEEIILQYAHSLRSTGLYAEFQS